MSVDNKEPKENEISQQNKLEQEKINNDEDEKAKAKTKAELRELLLKNILEMGKFSYELEEKREQSLYTQSSQMMTVISIFSAIIFFAVPIIFQYCPILISKLLICLAIESPILLSSLVLAFLAQWRFKYIVMQDVEGIYNSVFLNYGSYKTQSDFYLQWKEQLISVHQSKRDVDDKRKNLIKASMILFLFAIAMAIVFAFLLVLSLL